MEASASLFNPHRAPHHLAKSSPRVTHHLPSRLALSKYRCETSLRTRRCALRTYACASPDPVAALASPFAGSSASGAPTPTPGLYSAKVYDLTVENVDRVLDDVRPYLISDGGNVDVVSVDDGVISLRLQGACSSCPSSTTTMTMGIERVLKEKFGEAVKDIQQVNDVLPTETTAEAVNNHLDILRPAIKNYGGSVEVISVDGEDCLVKYVGPGSIGTGIKAAIRERFPDIVNVVFTE